MNNIEEYLNKTKSAVNKLFEAYNSYWELLLIPKRPGFSSWGDPDSIENIKAYEKWHKENKAIIEERLKKDDEYVYEFLARATLCGCILEFAFMGIKLFSNNTFIPDGFKSVIKPKTVASKFCIGRFYNDVPIGLMIYAGRNQAAHYDENPLREPNTTIFTKMANWYSSTFNKEFSNSYLDLKNNEIVHYAENITYYLGWRDYKSYENDMLNMLKNPNAI